MKSIGFGESTIESHWKNNPAFTTKPTKYNRTKTHHQKHLLLFFTSSTSVSSSASSSTSTTETFVSPTTAAPELTDG